MAHTLTTIYDIPIYSYGTSIAIGTLLSIYALHRDAHARETLDHEQIDTIVLAVIVAALCGGVVFAGFMHVSSCTWSQLPTCLLTQGISITGSVLGGIAAIGWYIHRYQLATWRTCDIFARYAPIVHAAGRIGCTLSGCCHGAATSCTLAITYTDPHAWAPLYVPLHPVPIYAAVCHCALWGILWIRSMYRPRAGAITSMYLMGFGCIRGLLDILRADFTPAVFGMSYTQLTSLGIFITGGAILLYTRYHEHTTR